MVEKESQPGVTGTLFRTGLARLAAPPLELVQLAT